jgi:hypothetical protein
MHAAWYQSQLKLTVVAKAEPGLIWVVPGRWDEVVCAVATEDPTTYAAVVPSHEDAERRLALVAGLADRVIQPVLVPSAALVTGEGLNYAIEETLHNERTCR